MTCDYGDSSAVTAPDGAGHTVAPDALIDIAHLTRQTMGDRTLQSEVLQLFARQAAEVADRIGDAAPDERQRMAHRLNGAARGVGASAVAACLAAIEKQPGDEVLLVRLQRLVEETRQRIASIEE